MRKSSTSRTVFAESCVKKVVLVVTRKPACLAARIAATALSKTPSRSTEASWRSRRPSMWMAQAKYGLGVNLSSLRSSSRAFVHRYTNFFRRTSSPAISWISGWIRGSPPAIETIGAPHSSIAEMACSTGIRRRRTCSGCWILPQPEHSRLHWNSGSSSTISGKRSRLASRWRARYRPMRVLCLNLTDIGGEP